MPNSLVVMLVDVRVKADQVEAFQAAARANAEGSRQEKGVLRFDVLQDRDAPTHFMLVEVYRDAAAVALHKETRHYQTWRDTVADMMAQPRQGTKYVNLSPDDGGW